MRFGRAGCVEVASDGIGNTSLILEPLIDQGQSDVETEISRAHHIFAAATELLSA